MWLRIYDIGITTHTLLRILPENKNKDLTNYSNNSNKIYRLQSAILGVIIFIWISGVI